MKFGQLLENNKKNIFPQESCRKCGRGTSSRPFCFFEKTLNGLKANGLELSFNIRARAIGREMLIVFLAKLDFFSFYLIEKK